MGKQYEMAFAIGAKVNGSFNAAFRSAATGVQGLQQQINSLNKTAGDISSYQKTQQAIEKTKQKLALYQQQYANLKAEMERNGQASAAEQNALLAKGKAIDDQKDKLAQLEGRLESTGAALEKEGVDLNNLTTASEQTGQQIDQLRQKQEELAEASGEAGNKMSEAMNNAAGILSSLGVMEGLKKVAEGFKECAEQAIAFEAEMAAVKRTVGGSDAFISDLGSAFKNISTEIPITTEELTKIATTAGQLGISADKVEEFTVVMAKLATTTDLSADQAATMLAQFANITGVTDYERLGAVVAQLGDSTATTASKVVDMSQGMAAAASIAGMSSTDIMAIAAALGSLGIEAQAGSTAMSQLINTLYKATETGENLEEFAAVAGMTAQQFKQAWATDAVGAMNAFITGLNNVEQNGASAIVVLDRLGISGVRQQKAILGLASAGDLLSNTISQANSAWEENTALNEKAGIMYETTQAKLTMMQNAFGNLEIAIGEAFAPVIGQVADALNNIIQPITKFIEENPQLVKAIAAAAAVIGVVTAAMAAYTIGAKIAAAASAAFTAAMPGGAAILAIAAGIALVTGVVVGLSDSTGAATESVDELTESYEELMDDVRHQNEIIDLCEEYKALSKQIDFAVDSTKQMKGFEDIQLSISATAEEELSPYDFLIDTEVDISGELDQEQIGTLDAGEFIEDGSDTVTLHPSTDSTEKIDPEKDMMTGTGVKLHVDEEGSIKIEASALVNGSTAIEFTASWANREEFEADVAALKAEAEVAKEDLATGQATLADMQKRAGELEARLLHAKTPKEQESLKKQIEELNGAIGEQEEKVAALQTAYEEAGGKYVIAAGAAETLASKEERLAEIQAQLGISSDGVAENIDNQTEAIWDQVEAVEGLTRAEKEAAKLKLVKYLGEKSEEYGWSYTSGVTQRKLTSAQALLDQKESVIPLVDYWLGQGYEAYNTQFKANLARLDELYDAGQNHTAEYFSLLSETQQMQSIIPKYIPGVRNDKTGYAINWSVYGEGGVSEGGRPAGAKFSDYYPYLALESQEVLTTAAVDAYQGVESQRDHVESIVAMQQDYIEQLAQNVNLGVITPEEMENLVNTYVTDSTIAAQTIDAVNARVVALQEEVDGAASSVGPTALEVQQAVQPIIDQMEELSEAYTNAYNAAYQSISGQFKLFESVDLAKPAEDATGAVQGYIDSLESQQAYIAQYRANLEAVRDMGLSDALIAELSDGSAESAQILANIVEGGADKIDELNAAFEGVETGKEQFADTVAEMQTDFTESMKLLKEQLDATVEGMNQTEEAAKAGADTVQAFADAAEGKVSVVESAFAKLSAAAQIKAKVSFESPWKSILGFAGGTDNAPEGFAMVGEEGPELMYLHGGEKILDAQETRRTMDAMSAQPVNAMSNGYGGSGQYTVEYKPQYNISGAMNADELRAVLDEHDADMRGKIEELLDEIETDNTRRKYA